MQLQLQLQHGTSLSPASTVVTTEENEQDQVYSAPKETPSTPLYYCASCAARMNMTMDISAAKNEIDNNDNDGDNYNNNSSSCANDTNT
jgi:hypothetical protein